MSPSKKFIPWSSSKPFIVIFECAHGLLRRVFPTDYGTFPVTVQVGDVLGQHAVQSFGIVVSLQAPPKPPVIVTSPQTGATLGTLYSQPITATDPQNEAITFTLTAYPSGMTIDG
jgi:hypothetical protein